MKNKFELTQLQNAKLSTGPVARDYKADGLLITIDNTTDNTITIDIFINDLMYPECDPKHVPTTLDPHTKKTLDLPKPYLLYEIIFDKVVEGVYCWTATKKRHKNPTLEANSFIAANTFTHKDLININNNPIKFATKFFTGPVVRDHTSHSLVTVIENTTSTNISIDLFVDDLTQEAKESSYRKVNLPPHCTKSFILYNPSLVYQIMFDKVVYGIYFWTATREEYTETPLHCSNFIASNTFCHTKLIGGN